MKKPLFFLFFISNCIYAQKQPLAHLSGKLNNFNNAVIVEDKSEFEGINIEDGQRKIVTDSNSSFKISFPLSQSNYFRIGRNIVYFSPNDHINLTIDYNNPQKAIFEGTHAMENTYLKNTPYPKGGSYLESGDGIKQTIPATIEYVLQQFSIKNKELLAIKDKVDSKFFRLELARCNADLINSLIKIYTYYTYINKTPKDSLPYIKNKIDSLTVPLVQKYSINFLQDENLQLVVYRDILDILIKYQSKGTTIPQKIQDWIKCNEIKDKALSLENKNEIKALKKEAYLVKTITYKNALIKTIDELTKINVGDEAKDFILTDLTGNKVSLSAFKNKVIYLDFWATWCGPCIANRPYLDSMIHLFKDNKDLVFLSISIDDQKDQWLTYLKKKNIYQYEYIVDRNDILDYHIVSIPRIILIDKAFKIVNLNAPPPNAKGLQGLLKKLSDQN
jgi:thiol-disulfide isomerase/thioredoxin